MIVFLSIWIVKRLITSEQIRAARALLKWSADELAEKSGVGIATIRRFESVNGIPSGQLRILNSLKITFEIAGIEFIGTPEDRPGVRFSAKLKDK